LSPTTKPHILAAMTFKDGSAVSLHGARDPMAQFQPQPRWSDLVLPDAQIEVLRSIAASFRLRHQSPPRTGSGTTGGGLKVLLTGELGTGRRLATRTLARELGIDVLEVEADHFAAGDPDGWAGAMEVQLAAALDSKLLFVGRVEALFGASRHADSAHRRDLGPERTELLRRIDTHPGLIVFSSQLRGRVAPELLELLDFEIDLPFPDAEARRRLWRLHLRAGAAIDPATLDWIAENFQLSGGSIAGAVSFAARSAAADGEALSLRQLVLGLEHEYAGRLINPRTREGLDRLHEQVVTEVEVRRGRAASAPRHATVGEPDGGDATATPTVPEPAPAARAHESATPPPEPATRTPQPATRAPEPTPRTPAPRGPEPATPGPTPTRASAPPPIRLAPAPTADTKPTSDSSPARPAVSTIPRLPARPLPEPRTATTRGRLTGLIVAVVIIAGGLGVLLAHALLGSKSSATVLGRHGSTAGLTFSYPNDWRTRTVPAQPALGLSDTAALAPRSGSGRMLLLGLAHSTDATLLPPEIQHAAGRLGPADVVVLGGARFYRYLDQSLSGVAGSASLYALPTTAGTIVGICEQTGHSAAFAGTCERIVGTARPTNGTLVALHPSQTYATALGAVMQRLDTQRTSGTTALSQAHASTAQATAARTLAADHLHAASAILALNAGQAKAANTALAAALRSAASGYSALAIAASHHDTTGYTSAQHAISAAEAKIAAALTALGAYGYVVS
jgi:hypothetical protein